MEEKKEIANTQGKFWTSSPLQAAQLVMGKEGPSALSPVTVISLFNDRVQKTPNLNALFVKRDGKWVSWTWKQYHEQVMLCARAILSFKPEPTDGVNIIGFNSPEWFMADLAGIAAGTIAAPIYSTNAPDAVHYIAEHSNGIVAFVENELQLAKFLKVRERLPKLQAIVQWSGKVPEEKGVYSWEAFLKLSEKVDPSELQKVIEAQTPTKCATLIYTSGTTGPPKAVMLSHDNITWTARVVQSHLSLVETDVLISYLPLSHIAAQMMDLITPLAGGYCMYFAQPDALKGSLATTIKEVQPTLFLGVPRVWEKFQEKMLEVGKSVTGVKRSLATWAKGKALENGYALQRHESGPWGFWLADTVVLSKVKQALGFTRLRLAATAAAPIAKETLDYFLSLNIPIYEIYGMSECTGPETFNLPTAFKIGSCGRIMPGTELKIDKPNKEGHGEICYRGRHIFMGYMKDPKASAETIDDEGYLHSGDIGILDKDGFLYITGRIKELIITAGGENIPPVLIEDEIKKELASVIANVMVVGDRKKFLTCIFTLKAVPIPDPKPGEYPFTEELAPGVIQALGDDSIKTVDAAIASEKVIKFLEAGVQKANSRATSNAQKVQKFIIVNRDFTIEGGELTPTLKLKRRIVLQQYQDQVEKLYQVDE